MKFRLLTLVILALGCCTSSVAADTAYVIDKLLVGVHQDQDLNSAIVKVLPTGTKLEVIERNGELALVKDAEGTSGWVDAAYLMEEPPAQVRVKTLADENAALTAKLAAAASGGAGAGPVSDEDRDKLTKENTELKRKLSAEKLKAGELQSAVAELEAKVADRPLTPADTIIAELEEANETLARDLEMVVQTNSELESKLEEQGGMPVLPVAAGSFSPPILAAFGVIVLIAFGAGVYAMDYLNRRRHGGFRV